MPIWLWCGVLYIVFDGQYYGAHTDSFITHRFRKQKINIEESAVGNTFTVHIDYRSMDLVAKISFNFIINVFRVFFLCAVVAAAAAAVVADAVAAVARLYFVRH